VASETPTVVVDAENVRRSIWPNVARDELVDRAARWASRHGHDAVVVWETHETADDAIARAVQEVEPPVWVVTSDRELRGRVTPYATRVIGGGSFVRDVA
jgi:predicted RNA-binding protein with PIN domain